MLYFLFIVMAAALAATQSDALNEDRALDRANPPLQSWGRDPLSSLSTPRLPHPYEVFGFEQGGDQACGPLSSLSTPLLSASGEIPAVLEGT